MQSFDPSGVARALGQRMRAAAARPARPGHARASGSRAQWPASTSSSSPSTSTQRCGESCRPPKKSSSRRSCWCAACHPRPGAAIYAPTAEYIVPDVFVRRIDGSWVVELNNSIAPRLRVNSVYACSLGRGEEYDALKVQLQEARWLIRSLEIRNETLLKVALTIVNRQTDFLEQGEEAMRPMVLRDIAEAIEHARVDGIARHDEQVHAYAARRVRVSLLLLEPRRRRRGRAIVDGRAGENSQARRSREARKAAQRLPIAKLLSEEGIKVARRTVAKYREAMKIRHRATAREAKWWAERRWKSNEGSS